MVVSPVIIIAIFPTTDVIVVVAIALLSREGAAGDSGSRLSELWRVGFYRSCGTHVPLERRRTASVNRVTVRWTGMSGSGFVGQHTQFGPALIPRQRFVSNANGVKGGWWPLQISLSFNEELSVGVCQLPC